MKFELGKTVLTRGIHEEMKDEEFVHEIETNFTKFVNCDWGDCCEEDKVANDEAVEYDASIVAMYITSKGKIFIITEWDRSVTTIMFADEY